VISCAAGSIVDFEVESRLSNQFGLTPITVSVGVLNKVYYLALDGPSSNIFRPVGLPSTA